MTNELGSQHKPELISYGSIEGTWIKGLLTELSTELRENMDAEIPSSQQQQKFSTFPRAEGEWAE